VDLLTAPRLFEELATAVEHKGRVVIDLAGMSFIDSQGIYVLSDACTARRGLGQGLVVRSPQPQARNMLRVSGLDKLLTLEGEPVLARAGVTREPRQLGSLARPTPRCTSEGEEASGSSLLPCLYPFCDGAVSFDLDNANGESPIPRALARCARGHLHYSSDGARYGTARGDG
jgi:anti-anti-sigma factor